MLEISRTDRLTICGLPNSGKTIFMRYLLSLADPEIYIIDPLDQYTQFGEVGDVLEGKKRWHPRQESPAELEMIARKFHAISNKVLAIEEAEQYMPQGKPLPDHTSSLIRMGRNWGIGIWATTRRIQDINKRFYDLCQRVFFFRCGFKSREYIGDMMGNEYVYPAAHPRLNKTGYAITTLPPWHALHFDLEYETAQIVTLKLRPTGGGQIQEIGKKGDAGKNMVKQIADAAEEEAGPPKDTKLWTPSRRDRE